MGSSAIFQLIGADVHILAQEPPLPEDQRLTARAGPDLEAAIRSGSTGTLTGIFSTDGIVRTGAFRQLGDLPIHVVIGAAKDTVMAAWLDRSRPYIVFSLISLAALSVLTLIAVRRAFCEDRVRAELMDAKAHLEERIAERTSSLTEALKQREMLFKELNHRVKNNLQLISSFIRLQGSKTEDTKIREGFEACLSRIRSIGVVHELLYRTDDVTVVDFAEYIRLLCSHLSDALGDDDAVAIRVDAESAALPVDSAIPLALIVNELIANALKHAFPSGGPGTITVSWHDGSDGYELLVSDDGIGLGKQQPNDTALAGTSLGLTLVNLLVRQISGTLTREATERGTAFRIHMPRDSASYP